MHLGPYDVRLIETCRFALDGGAMFGVVPKNLWSKAYPHLDDQNRIAMAARALLIRGNGHTIVVDAGCGHKLSPKLESIYALDHSEFTLDAELLRNGVRPDEVTHFIYTHLHFDHAGGSTVRTGDGLAVPLFPNARHYVQREQLAWGRNPSDKDRASFMPENWEPVVEHGLMEELEGAGEVVPGVEVRPVYGHTAAMQAVIVHGDERDGDAGGLLYCVDLMPTAAHVPLPYVMGYDNFPLTTIEEKRAILPEAHERRWVLAFEHDPFTEGVRVGPGERGFGITARTAVNTPDTAVGTPGEQQ